MAEGTGAPRSGGEPRRGDGLALEAAALFFVAGIGVLSLVWGVFNTWELIFRVQGLDQP